MSETGSRPSENWTFGHESAPSLESWYPSPAGRGGQPGATVNQAMDDKAINQKSAEPIATALGLKLSKAFTVTILGEPMTTASVIA